MISSEVSLGSHILFDFGQELARAEGLRHVVVAPGEPRLLLVTTQRVGRDHDDGDRLEIGIGLDTPRRLVAVEQRQLDIHEDQVGAARLRGCHRVLAVLGFDQVEAGPGEQIMQDPSVVLLVLDHENALLHVPSVSAVALTGRLTENVAPAPGLDSTEMLPPCISMIRLAIARPSPLPPLVLVAELSAWWNSSKILTCSPSGIPGPVSHTATLNEPLRARALIATSPLSVNLIALPTRLSSTCAMRRSSPHPAGRSGMISILSPRPFSVASDSTEVTTLCTTSPSE